MPTQRNRTGNRLNKAPESSTAERLAPRKIPIQQAIQKLEKELHALNERVAELRRESRRHSNWSGSIETRLVDGPGLLHVPVQGDWIHRHRHKTMWGSLGSK